MSAMNPWIPRIGGFLFYPIAGAIATRLASSATDTASQRSTKAAICHAAAGGAAWYASTKTKRNTQDFFDGGMWGEVLAAGTVVAVAPPSVTVTATGAPTTSGGQLAHLSAFLQTADVKALLSK